LFYILRIFVVYSRVKINNEKKENRAETVDYHVVRQICNMVEVDLDLIII